MSTSIENLLTHRDWVRRVARALVSSEDEAREIEQEAWVRAVARPPAAEGKAKAWFRTVLKRVARDRWRNRTRRDAREQQAPRPTASAPTADLVAEAESHRLVVNAAMALPDPYREAIVLRFFHELPAAEIAERLDIPLETVRTRVKRALARLRKELDDRHGGDRKAWTALVALLLPTPAKAGMALGVKVGLVAAAASLLVATVALWPKVEEPLPKTTIAKAPLVVPAGEFEVTVPVEIDPIAAPPVEPASAEEFVGPNLPALPPPPPEPALVVKVIDPRGRPVAGAALSIHPIRPRRQIMEMIRDDHYPLTWPGPLPASFRGETGPTGEIAVPELPSDRVEARVAADGFVPVTRYPGNERTRRLTIVLVPGVEVSGTVRLRSGAAIQNAAVGSRFGRQRTRVVTDRNGAYRLAGVPSGPTALRVQLPTGPVVVGETIDTRNVRKYDFVLDLEAAVRGRIVDARTGRGVEGVRVRAWAADAEVPESGISAFASTVTDKDGRYAIETLPRGRLHSLHALAEGYLRVSRNYHPNYETLRAGRPVTQDIRLLRGAVVRGEVRFDSGEPAPGAQINLTIKDWPDEFDVVADRRGRFVFPAVPPGVGRFHVRGPGLYYPDSDRGWRFETAPEHKRVVVPATGEVRKTLRVAHGAIVEGVVLDPDGTPKPGVTVFSRPFGGLHTVTDEYGRFRVAGIPPGEAVRIHERSMADGFGVSQPFRVYGNETVAGIVVTPRRRTPTGVAGIVRGPGATLPDDVRLVIAKGERMRWENGHPVPVLEDGTFRIEDLAPGHHTLLVASDGYGEGSVAVDDLAAEEMREGIVIRLLRERRIDGRVIRVDGKPTAGTPIHALPWREHEGRYGSGERGAIRAFAGETGRFTLSALAPGRYRVTAGLPGMIDISAIATAGDGDVVIEARRGRRITGILLDTVTGKPAANVSVVATAQALARTQAAPHAGTRTGPDGRFVLDSLLDLTYALEIADIRHSRPEDPEYVRQKRQVRAGARNLKVHVVPGQSIEGRVLGGDRKPLGHICVDSSRYRHLDAWTRPDGTFRLQRLGPGKHNLRISDRSRRGLVTIIKKGVPAGTRDLLFVMETGPSITGTVLDPDGRVSTDRRGSVAISVAGAGRYTGMRVAKDGTFRSRPLNTGTAYDVRATGYAGTIGVRVARVLAGTESVRLRLRRGGTISGRVLDENGEPVPAGVYVSATANEHRKSLDPLGDRPRTKTKEDGTFVMHGVGDLTFRLYAGASGNTGYLYVRTEASKVVRPGTRDLVLRVTRTVSFSGRLVDRNGRPVACLLWKWQHNGSGRTGSWSRTTGEGKFSWGCIRPGPIQLVAEVSGVKIDLGEFTAPAQDLVITVPGTQ